MPLIRYVGKKEIQVDVLYESGTTWNGNGDIQQVSDDIAAKLLKHKDAYAEASEEELNDLPGENVDADNEAAKPSFVDAAAVVVVRLNEIDLDAASEEELDSVGKITTAVNNLFPLADVEDAKQETESDNTGSGSDNSASLQEQIIAAINTIDEDDASLWSENTGKPHVKSIEGVLGYDITAADRDDACAAIDAAE